MNEKQISELVYRLVTRDGFVDTFWHELAAARRADPAASRRQVFERLNGLYEQEFGRPQFPSYEAFRKVLNRR